VQEVGENEHGELLRILIPRTPVNKGKRKGRGCYAPALSALATLLVSRAHNIRRIRAKPALYYLRLGPHHLLKDWSSEIDSQPA
jgi:hypothetical protein